MHSNLYVGLAGETDSYPGYDRSSGFYRSRGGTGPWERCTEGLPDHVEVRSIVLHPHKPGCLYIATQRGIYRSDDGGSHFKHLTAPEPGMAVWSLCFHPQDPAILLAGYEPCTIWYTRDEGATWQEMPVRAKFPHITLEPRLLPKRILDIAVDPEFPQEIYAAIEVGGLLRSTDFGRTWEQVLHGPFDSYDRLDLHSLTIHGPRQIYIAHRAGIESSSDGGNTWRQPSMAPGLSDSLYCRMVRFSPQNPRTMYVAHGGPFDDSKTVMQWGGLLRSLDGGKSFHALDLGGRAQSTMFTVTIDPRASNRVFCGNYGGQVFYSDDGGAHWHEHSLPEGATKIYAMAVG